MELKKPHLLRLAGGAQMQNRLVPHPCVVEKKTQEGYLRSKDSQPHTGLPSPEFQCQEDKSPQLLVANQQGLSQWKKLLEPQAVPLKEPTHELTYTDSLPLSSSTRIAA